MPLYEYTNDETGLTAIVNRPLADRNKPLVLTFERKPVPSSLGPVGVARQAPTAREQVLDGYRQAECQPGGLRSEFSPKQIKEIWSGSHDVPAPAAGNYP